MNKQLLSAASALLCVAATQSAFAAFQLRVTEIFPFNSTNTTEDWFEVTNIGDSSWVASTHGGLWWEDASVDPVLSVPLSGVPQIAPGETVLFVDLANGDSAKLDFANFWGPAVAGKQIGTYVNGPGLGTGGDSVALWVSPAKPLAGVEPHTVASFPDGAAASGRSYDVRLATFSTVGNPAGATQRQTPPPDPTTGSPGRVAAFSPVPGVVLRVTEIWPGNIVNPDTTADWFEITNIGTQAWVAATHGNLYYNDSEGGADTDVQLTGVTTIPAGGSAVFVEGTSTTAFKTFWEPVMGGTITVGLFNGAGLSLSQGGDVINIWQSATPPVPGDVAIISEELPDATGANGASWDVPLNAFSTNGNSASAVTVTRTIAPAPNVASPGTVSSLNARAVPFPGWLLAPVLVGAAAIVRRRRRA